MSERGVFVLDYETWDMFDNDAPLTEREAYLWVGLNGPVLRKFSWLARQWRWAQPRVRAFVYKLSGAGLLEIRGRQIYAVHLWEAQAKSDSFRSWAELREAVFARDGYCCVYCGAGGAGLHCDHVTPRIQGGADTFENLATSCAPCNLSKGGRTPEEWRQ